MVYKVILTQNAEDDLAEIVGYISEILLNKTAAASLLSDFQEYINVLKENPFAFSTCTDLRLSEEGYRKFIFKKNYIALYKIDDLKKEVSVMRIFYGKRNYADLI